VEDIVFHVAVVNILHQVIMQEEVHVYHVQKEHIIHTLEEIVVLVVLVVKLLEELVQEVFLLVQVVLLEDVILDIG
jgi:hypothetical protein